MPDLIKTSLGKCGSNDTFYLDDSGRSQSLWKIAGKNLFGDIKVKSCEGSTQYDYPETKIVWRRKRLIESLL